MHNLDRDTFQVFEQCAPEYLQIDKHWGCDLDIIRACVEQFQKAHVLEIGVGHAWHLANLFLLCPNHLERVVGVDYSQNMLDRAKQLVQSLNIQVGAGGVELHQCDLFDLPCQEVEEGSFDVVLLLNNTLGNLPDKNGRTAAERRREALSILKRLLKPGGYLVLSVNNAERLHEEEKYGDVLEVDWSQSNLENFDLVVRYQSGGQKLCYYSHWFTRAEITRLVFGASFKVVEVEERRMRIVLVAQKRKQGT